MAEETKKMQEAGEEPVTDEEPAVEIEQTEEAAAQEETAPAEEESGEIGTEDAETEEDAGSGEEAEESGESEESAETEPGEKKSLFGRKKEKKDKKDQKIEELTDRLQRTMAEFDNFRKRTDKEKASMYVIGAKEIVEKILPVADNFERGLATAPEGDAFAEGMQLVYKQLLTTLEDLGVEAIEAVGKPFDPNFHNAVMHVDDPEQEDNVVVEEFQKGYTYKGFVVRHSMVKVAN